MHKGIGRSVFILVAFRAYLVFITLIWKLDVDIIFNADLADDCTFAANNFRVILGIYSDDQLKASQCLENKSQLLKSVQKKNPHPLMSYSSFYNKGSKKTSQANGYIV